MDVRSVVAADPEAATKAFREYRAAWLADRNRIDAELMRGYKALSEGKTLISLTEAIQTSGIDDQGRPNIAIARADETAIEVFIRPNGGLRYGPLGRATAGDRVFELPEGTISSRQSSAWWQARTPFIPPRYRPPQALVNYHLLWEAEWRRSVGPQRRDPMLLRRIGGDLFAVVAAWDLTDLEKLVLAR